MIPVDKETNINLYLSICLNGESGLEGKGVVIRIGRFPVQTLLGVLLGLVTQPRYEDPGDLWVEIVKTQ